MPSQWLIDLVNVYGGLTSLLLGTFSIGLSFGFAVMSYRSERQTSTLLTRMETQIETLQSVNQKLLSRAVQHIQDTNEQLISKVISSVNAQVSAGEK